MASHLLLEGILDVKDPRGSGDRKFWKVWRRAWTSFSVVYPSGRREPYLVLNLCHSSTEEKETNISRDGLRLFRCRSKSRPYRTWAMASGNKVLLYFAAESEVQGQYWMQTVRDGLWPPCFSFQMLAACSQEVSLIDDDNTFMSGLLGVYGRFVLTSEDVISLMHPYWGATLLQISLNNINDVLFVRDAEVFPAGVFSIVLKRVESSKVKALQFFCNTAREAMQWILSKMYAKSLKASPEATESRDWVEKKTVLSNGITQVNCSNEKTGVLNTYPSTTFQNTVEAENTIANIESEYENVPHSKANPLLKTDGSPQINMKNISNSVEYDRVSYRISTGRISERNPLEQSRANDSLAATNNTTKNKSSDFNSNDNIYSNIVHATDNTTVKSTIHSNAENEYENIKLLSEKDASSTKISTDVPESAIYSIVSKHSTRSSKNKAFEVQVSTSELSINGKCVNANTPESNSSDYTEYLTNSSKTFRKNTEISSVFRTSEASSDYLIGNGNKHEIEKTSDADFISKQNMAFHPNSHLSSAVNNDIPEHSDKLVQHEKLSIKDSSNDYNNIKMDNSRLLPTLPSDFLDTSIISGANFKDKINRGSLTSEDDTDIFAWITDDSNDFNSSDRFYEDIMDRKGTVYEEIDTSDDEIKPYLPPGPELPKRPENLPIPDSLRLQKLSKNITETLKIIENTDTATKEFRQTKLVKKIKDTNRIMRLNPNQEHAREHFVVEPKLPAKRNITLGLGATAVHSSINTKR